MYKVFMANSMITVNVDKKTKDEAAKIFNDLGLNMSTAVNIFLKACIKEQGIPFLISNKEE